MKKTFKEWRIEKGFRSGWVAEKLGLGTAQFCNKENGSRHFNVKEAQQLLEIYQIELSEVILL